MDETITRREFAGIIGAAIVAVETAGQAGAAERECAAGPRCPHFDQPLFCNGKHYCEN